MRLMRALVFLYLLMELKLGPSKVERSNALTPSEPKIKRLHLSLIIEERLICYFDHIMRKCGENLERLIVVGNTEDIT